MIKNNRQYMLSKKQLEKFSAALESLERNPPTDRELHPLFADVQKKAIESQLTELREEVLEYEELVSGRRKIIECESLADLPKLLIQGRIASGLSHKDLSERLGLKEQQIQRYEATDYESASLNRIREIGEVLGIKFSKKVYLPQKEVTLSSLLQRASSAGLREQFILKRLTPSNIRFAIRDGIPNGLSETKIAGKIAELISRVFNWESEEFFSQEKLVLPAGLAPAFKIPKNADAEFAKAYTVYAHYLAILSAESARDLPVSFPSCDHIVARKKFDENFPEVTLQSLLEFVWDLGIPVLPLNDSGAFHGACWRINGRNVIVLKQKSKSQARWLFDLLHELYHASKDPEKENISVVEIFEDFPNYKDSKEEQEAAAYAGNFLLNGKADEFADKCISMANGRVELLKRATLDFAERNGLNASILANYLAFRLSMEGINWWGTASNIELDEKNPWIIARDIFLRRIDLRKLNDEDKEIIKLAMINEEI